MAANFHYSGAYGLIFYESSCVGFDLLLPPDIPIKEGITSAGNLAPHSQYKSSLF